MAKALQVSDNTTVAFALTRFSICANASTAADATEARTQITYRTAGTLSNLWVYVNTNNLNGSTTIITRKNGENGAQSVSFASSTTGTAEDTTNSDTIAAGDEVNYQYVTGGTTGTISVRTITTVFAAT